jgi:hypothetical protein
VADGKLIRAIECFSTEVDKGRENDLVAFAVRCENLMSVVFGYCTELWFCHQLAGKVIGLGDKIFNPEACHV